MAKKTKTKTLHDADREILDDFKRSRRKTVDLLKLVPPKLLKCKAAGEDETTGALFHHISATIEGWMLRCMNDGGPTPEWKLKKSPGKVALLKELKNSDKRLLKFFRAKNGANMSAKFGGEWKGKHYTFTGRNRVMYLTQHEVHHRGKIVLALRQWGFRKIPFLPFE